MTVPIHPREPVILASDFAALVDWYEAVLGFTVVRRFEDDFHYCNLETPTGIKLGIAAAEEMGVVPGDRRNNTVVLQFAAEDVRELFAHLESRGASITNGPSFDKDGEFWFGGFADPEGNPCWVVDTNCP